MWEFEVSPGAPIIKKGIATAAAKIRKDDLYNF